MNSLPYLYGVQNWKRDQDFLVKIKVVHIGRGLSTEGRKNCFSLVMYEFCSNDALYSANFSFTMFIFLLTPINTQDYYYFKSSIILVLYIKALLIKEFVTLLRSLLDMKKWLSLMPLFLYLFHISLDQNCQKMQKVWAFGKKK